MGRRREEKVDEEELARLENPEGSPGKIRVKLPNDGKSKGELGYKGEMFALAEEILGGRRVTVLCADGETRMARIPGKMRRRQWVREGDLIIVWPWDSKIQRRMLSTATPKHKRCTFHVSKCFQKLSICLA